MKGVIIMLCALALGTGGCAPEMGTVNLPDPPGNQCRITIPYQGEFGDELTLPDEFKSALETVRTLTQGIIMNNSGRYLCPYTQDDVLAEWTDLVINAKIGETAGGTLGTVGGSAAGRETAEKLFNDSRGAKSLGGLIGGLVGKEIGKAVGKNMALNAAGGMDNIRRASDISFNNINDLARYLYLRHSEHTYIKDALNAATLIYPGLASRYEAVVSQIATEDVEQYRKAVKLLSNE